MTEDPMADGPPRVYARGLLITSDARPASQDIALTSVFTNEELPLG